VSSDLYVPASGAIERARELDVVANNLANMETNGYRKIQPLFEEFLGRSDMRKPGQAPEAVYPSPRVIPVSKAFVSSAGTGESQRGGTLRKTEAPLDMAIEGDGFFVLNTAQGLRYTRDGHFTRNPDGILAANDGSPVMTDRGPLPLGQGSITVSSDGMLSSGGQDIGRLQLVRFEPGAEMTRQGTNRYQAKNAGVAAAPKVLQGTLESSNVKPLSEMIALMQIQRNYDALNEVIRSYREIGARDLDVGRSG